MKSIKHMIQSGLVRLGMFIAKLGGWSKGITPSDTMAEDVLKLAIILVKRQDDQWPERDGECKRACVYGQLINTYPNHNKKMISRAIEEALCGGY